MTSGLMSRIDPWDIVAFAAFLVVWNGYSLYVDRQSKGEKSLAALVNRHRLFWMRRMIERENRIGDTAMISNLSNNVSFLASTTMLILGGALALLGSAEHSYTILMELPYVQQTSKELYELKIVMLALIFVYAFFKFTWSLQQFNFFNIMLGSAPEKTAPEEIKQAFVSDIARLNGLAGRSYHQGVRAYYFAFAAIAWFFHWEAFLISTLWVTAILWRREFHSRTLKAVKSADHGG